MKITGMQTEEVNTPGDDHKRIQQQSVTKLGDATSPLSDVPLASDSVLRNGNGIHIVESEIIDSNDRAPNGNQSRTSPIAPAIIGGEHEPPTILHNNDQLEQPLNFELAPDMHSNMSVGNYWPAQHQEEPAMFQNFQPMNPQQSIPTYGLNNNNSFPPQMQAFGSIGQPNYMPASHGQYSSPPGMHGMSMMGNMGPMNGPMGNFSYQNAHNQNQRRAITAQHNYGSMGGKPMNARYPWGNQQNTWPSSNQQTSMSPWTMALQQQKAMSRGPPVNMPQKNGPQSQTRNQMGNLSMIQHKFNSKRSSPSGMMGAGTMKPTGYSAGADALDPSSGYQTNMQGMPGDSMKMDALQTQILDIMRQSAPPYEQEQNKGYSDQSGLEFGSDDVTVDQQTASLSAVAGGGSGGGAAMNGSSSYSSYPSFRPDRPEKYSRKVFVGGLPPDIDEDEISASFRKFGPVVVDWPHKAESKSYFPPKGYCFLLFQEEISVQSLIDNCLADDNKYYWCVTSPTMKDKPVQIRPWSLSDSDFVMDGSQPLDPRKTIFVGGVPRPLRAVELAMIIDRLYGGVCYAGIDTDPELKYPKGAGRVAFSNQQSYIAAISARFVQLQHADIDKRVEVKPYVLDDQFCDECQGARCNQKFAPFFCANITCLQYYCEQCWATIHSRAGREYHKPLVKEGADRPRAVPFRWC